MYNVQNLKALTVQKLKGKKLVEALLSNDCGHVTITDIQIKK